MAFIEVVEFEKSEGRLKSIYEDILKSRGKLADVHTIQSLNPESIVKHMDLYMHIMFGTSPLSRAQREMIAIVVSSTNKCEYCKEHHAAALMNYWKKKERVDQLSANYQSADLSETDLLYCFLAQTLTKMPDKNYSREIILKMKGKGISDREILDTTLVIAYFNFVNRLVIGLGLDVETEEIKGYKY